MSRSPRTLARERSARCWYCTLVRTCYVRRCTRVRSARPWLFVWWLAMVAPQAARPTSNNSSASFISSHVNVPVNEVSTSDGITPNPHTLRISLSRSSSLHSGKGIGICTVIVASVVLALPLVVSITYFIDLAPHSSCMSITAGAQNIWLLAGCSFRFLLLRMQQCFAMWYPRIAAACLTGYVAICAACVGLLQCGILPSKVGKYNEIVKMTCRSWVGHDVLWASLVDCAWRLLIQFYVQFYVIGTLNSQTISNLIKTSRNFLRFSFFGGPVVWFPGKFTSYYISIFKEFGLV